MNQLTDDEFLEFLASFDKKVYNEGGRIHKCYDSLTELSKSENRPFNSVITDNFEMYGLDWIVKTSDKWKDKSIQCQRNPNECNHNPPKTTDAIYCQEGENGKLILHIIEFKFVGLMNPLRKLDYFFEDRDIYFDDELLGDLKDVVKRSFLSRIENSLQLKPYETIFVVLPELYDEYCKIKKETEKDFEQKDIKAYLSKMEKYYWICIDTNNGSRNEQNLRFKAQIFDKYCKRMEPVIFKQASAKTKNQFKKILTNEILSN